MLQLTCSGAVRFLSLVYAGEQADTNGVPTSGNLARHVTWWERNCPKGSFVLGWIKRGFPIWWRDPSIQPGKSFSPNSISASQHADFVSEQIDKLVAARAVEQVSSAPHVVNPLLVAPKANGKLRLILDLRTVNEFVDAPKFSMESLGLASSIAEQGDAMFSVDLADAYHQVEMSPQSWKFLGFSWKGLFYVYKVLPFGLATAPWCFHKVARVVVGVLRALGIRLISYMDDFLFFLKLIAGPVTRSLVLGLFSASGFVVNLIKSKLFFVTRIEHLGFVIDTVLGLYEVTLKRWTGLQDLISSLLSSARHPVRKLAKFTGHVVSMMLALGPIARMFTRAAYHLIAGCDDVWSAWVTVTPELRRELSFWAGECRSSFTSKIWPPVFWSQITIHSDASKTAWGAVLDDLVAHGYFSPDERKGSSTLRELLAVLYALQSWGPNVQGKSLLLQTDNQAVPGILLYGSRKPHLHAVSIAIFWLVRERGVRFKAEWIPRELNTEADEVSKLFDGDDWKLNPAIFASLDAAWGPHTVDRFASHSNNLVPRFYSRFSCPNSLGVDCFAHPWKGENNWCNPPFHLIALVLAVLKEQRAEATVIVPVWPTQSWWPIVAVSKTLFAPFVVGCRIVSRRADTFLSGHGSGNTVGSGVPSWQPIALRISFVAGSAPAAVRIPAFLHNV